jgi:quinoprotein glucose dehydrogenase
VGPQQCRHPLFAAAADHPGQRGTLQLAWQFRTGDLPKKRWGAETTPLKIGDRLYLCTARNRLIALDAASGKELWRFDPKVKDASIPIPPPAVA